MDFLNPNSPFGKWLTLVAQFTTAFAAIYLGVLALGWDLLGIGLLLQNASSVVRTLLYAVGIFGFISFVVLVLRLLGKADTAQKR